MQHNYVDMHAANIKLHVNMIILHLIINKLPAHNSLAC